jgi:hypothetical protein
VPAAFAPARGASVRPRRGGGVAPPCFASVSRHEIVIGERKLVGSAQRRTARGLLQQGSVLLGAGHLRLAAYLRVPSTEREAVRATLASASAHAGPWIPGGAPLELWAEALAAVMPGARRVDGAEGSFLLTPGKPGFYTARRPGEHAQLPPSQRVRRSG